MTLLQQQSSCQKLNLEIYILRNSTQRSINVDATLPWRRIDVYTTLFRRHVPTEYYKVRWNPCKYQKNIFEELIQTSLDGKCLYVTTSLLNAWER